MFMESTDLNFRTYCQLYSPVYSNSYYHRSPAGQYVCDANGEYSGTSDRHRFRP